MTVLLRIPACYPLRVSIEPPASDDSLAIAGPAADHSTLTRAPVRRLEAVKRLVHEAAAQAYLEHETAAGFGRVSGVRVRALRERLRPHSRVRIEPLDMRRVCELPDRSTLIGLRDAALLATLASSALRVAELAGLRAEDVVSRRGGWLLLVLGKGDEEVREAPLAREAKE